MKKRSGFGWIQFIIGILMIALGIITLIKPDGAITWLVVVYGLMAIITGICDIIFYIKEERYLGFGPVVALISGIFGVMVGSMLLITPATGRFILAFLFPIWFIAHCVSHLSHLEVIRATAGSFYYYFVLVTNILGLILGIMMLFQPIISLLSVGLIIGIYLIILGINSIVIAFSKMGSIW